MGNLLTADAVARIEMATNHSPAVGIAHPTVVPRNFEHVEREHGENSEG